MAIFANNYKNIAQRHGFWTQQHIRERRIMKAKNINTDRSRQEITKNIPGFPVSCYLSEFTSGAYDHIDWHWHVEFQLCLTISGAVVWNTGNQQITAARGRRDIHKFTLRAYGKTMQRRHGVFLPGFSAGFSLHRQKGRSL